MSDNTENILASALGLLLNIWLFSYFTELEEHIDLYEITITRKLLEENLKEEALVLLIDTNGNIGITASFDGSWTNSGSGRTYNSK